MRGGARISGGGGGTAVHGGGAAVMPCGAVRCSGGGAVLIPATSLRPYQQQVCALLHAFVAFFGFQHHICTLIAQSFGRLARAENKSAERAPFARGGAVARTAYFCQSMNKVEPHWGVKMKQNVRRRYGPGDPCRHSPGPTGSVEALCFPSSLLRTKANIAQNNSGVGAGPSCRSR